MLEAPGIAPPAGRSLNARAAQIRKFVVTPPERGHVLRLVSIDDPPCVLGEWPRTACAGNGSIADDIDRLFVEHGNTLGTEVGAHLAWVDEAKLIVQAKRLKYRPEPNDVDPLAAEAMGINGTAQGERMQNQRLAEAFARINASLIQGSQQQQVHTLREQREVIGLLLGLCKELAASTRNAQAELDKAYYLRRKELEQRDQLLRDTSDPEAAASAMQSELMSQALEQFAPVVPVFLQAMMQWLQTRTGGAPPPMAAAE
jgi:hypothetical protein